MLERAKLSSLVESQLPSFVREDHQAFVAFLEAYYEFLETRVAQPKTLRDVNTTLDEFIYLFKRELASNIPYTVVNERFLLTHIKDLYLAKGSEASFKLLFRLLFNKDVTVEYPSRQILRASDGKWKQDVSVFARVNAGNPDDIVGKLVDVVTPNRVIRVMIDRRQDVEVEVDRVVQISEDIFEFYIDRRFFGNISVNDRLRYGGIFDATILPTTATISIQQGGTGFRLGQLYEIKSGHGYGSMLKVSRVDEKGSIKAAEFIKYGVGYETNFIATFLSQAGQTTAGAGQSALNIGDGQVGIFETTQGFREDGFINTVDYLQEDDPNTELAWQGDYAGEVIREFSDDGRDDAINPDAPAIIRVELGAVAKYPGYFRNNDGFLNDAIFIQDSSYYQAFSYVIKIDERLDNYRSAVKTLIHPAGMALFGEYDIRNEFDISLSLEAMIKVLSINRQDEVFVSDEALIYAVTKHIETLQDTDDSTFFNMHKVLTDSTPVDTTIPLLDFNKVLSENQPIVDEGTFFEFHKTLADLQGVSDGALLSFNKPLSDSQSLTDEISFFEFTKYIEEVLISEDEGHLFLNPYITFPETYWDISYAEGKTDF